MDEAFIRQLAVKRGYVQPQMVARFTINAVPALAVIDRHASIASNDAPKEMWAAVDDVAQPAEGVVVLGISAP